MKLLVMNILYHIVCLFYVPTNQQSPEINNPNFVTFLNYTLALMISKN